MSGLGASRMEQGTTGQCGLAERVVRTNPVLDSSIPMLQLGTSIHAVDRYCVCVCVLSTGGGRAAGGHNRTTCSGVRACRGP